MGNLGVDLLTNYLASAILSARSEANYMQKHINLYRLIISQIALLMINVLAACGAPGALIPSAATTSISLSPTGPGSATPVPTWPPTVDVPSLDATIAAIALTLPTATLDGGRPLNKAIVEQQDELYRRARATALANYTPVPVLRPIDTPIPPLTPRGGRRRKSLGQVRLSRQIIVAWISSLFHETAGRK
jgi:hypothetical protein